MSQQGIALLTLPCVATTAVTQHRGVTFGDAQVSVAGTACKGVARRGAASGAEFEVVSKGTWPWEAGGSFAIGTQLGVDGSGRVITWASGFVAGYALQAAGAAGDLPEVLLS